MAAYKFLRFLFLCTVFHLSSSGGLKNLSIVPFNEGFNPLYGELNVIPSEDNKSVKISMDENSSSGFHSKAMYIHGYFGASIKLPGNYSAGVVVTFYTTNNQEYPYRHDEIDFEFLGHIDGQEWVVQTNFYGNGSTNRGREERYVLWFDPAKDFHNYGILWTKNRIRYYVDHVPIREVERVDTMKGDFPAKPMALYGTIWNGSNWATYGGKYKLDLKYGPYIAKFSNFMLNGCPFDPTQKSTRCDDNPGFYDISLHQRTKMKGFRRKYMTYSYCYDKKRYNVSLPECLFDSKEFEHLQKFDPWTFGAARRARK
ncbi:putative xyloglucan endotransglucosylase/hydrolase protein 28 [Forsythia ovata]|uniref:Xyloglucan endotransglucosylase/hydrolase n=1 Tax=Forsythia ovata TaxID=205694 RepID=A0ABD1QR11_9LAMI